MDDKKSIMLYIPLGINTRMDFFPGFGKKEMAQASIGMLFTITIAIISYMITNLFLTVVVIMIIGIGISVMMTTKGSTNQSAVDLINNVIKFSNDRKVYPYRQLSEWI